MDTRMTKRAQRRDVLAAIARRECLLSVMALAAGGEDSERPSVSDVHRAHHQIPGDLLAEPAPLFRDRDVRRALSLAIN